MFHSIGSKIRKLIFFITALVSLFIFIFLRPRVEVEPYVEDTGGSEAATDSDENSDKHWTRKTRGHKMAVAIGNSLSPDEEDKENE